jgi:2-methylcitrate dehydratase PrpD
MPQTDLPHAFTRRLAAFAIDTPYPDLPAAALDLARLSLLDWCAVALAGLDEPVGRIVRTLVESEAGRPEATVIGLDDRLPARAAALANGTLSHALDYDDTHFGHIGHPTVAVLPAALAVAEQANASGAELLAAYLIGVETACRLGAALGPGHYQHGFHQTATSGSFGATAACARLLGLDIDATSHALGLTATRASGLKSQFGTMGKPFHAGMAAANGVEAATLASLGFVSRPDGIECPQGFAATHVAELNEHEPPSGSYLFETIQYKFHACCHGTHAALEALLSLRTNHPIQPGQVASVTLTTHPTWLKVCDIAAPTTGLEAKFSYRLTAAMVLGGIDTAALTSFSGTTCARPELIALRDLVRVAADTDIAETAARVEIALDDGRSLVAEHDLADPIPLANKQAKLRAKADALIGAESAERLSKAIANLEEQPASALADVLRTAGI